jgi:hypothetical protein
MTLLSENGENDWKVESLLLELEVSGVGGQEVEGGDPAGQRCPVLKAPVRRPLKKETGIFWFSFIFFSTGISDTVFATDS